MEPSVILLSLSFHSFAIFLHPVQILGTTQGIAIVENLIEHVAKARQEDPLEFRLKNLNTTGASEASAMHKIIDEVRRSSEFDKRLNEVRTTKHRYWMRIS